MELTRQMSATEIELLLNNKLNDFSSYSAFTEINLPNDTYKFLPVQNSYLLTHNNSDETITMQNLSDVAQYLYTEMHTLYSHIMASSQQNKVVRLYKIFSTTDIAKLLNKALHTQTNGEKLSNSDIPYIRIITPYHEYLLDKFCNNTMYRLFVKNISGTYDICHTWTSQLTKIAYYLNKQMYASDKPSENTKENQAMPASETEGSILNEKYTQIIKDMYTHLQTAQILFDSLPDCIKNAELSRKDCPKGNNEAEYCIDHAVSATKCLAENFNIKCNPNEPKQ